MMICDIVQQNSIGERDKLCANHWTVHTVSTSYAEDCQLCAKLCIHNCI